ncbi:MAG: RecX family transcriptional regulator [Clostridia bacterium]|nr:RecX family transcriptional regulator [Clostridia bacterium]
MIITKIKRIANTNRFHVYADEEWTGVFLDEILVSGNIKTGAEFDESEFKTIKKENDVKVAFDMAVSYLEKYVVSEKGLKDYLKKKNYSYEVILQVVDKLRDYGFLDDEKFAKNYFETLSASKGKRAIAQKLKQKGVSSEIVENLMDGVDEEAELEKATALADKFVKNRQKDTKTKKKCIAHLIYKGYDYSVAQKAADCAMSNIGENDDWV